MSQTSAQAKQKTDPRRLKASNRRAGRKIGGSIAIFLFLLILGLFMVLPIWLMIVNSIKPVNEIRCGYRFPVMYSTASS